MRFGSLFLQVQVCLLVTPVSHSHEWWQYAVLVTHVKSISPYHIHTRTDRSDSTLTTTELNLKLNSGEFKLRAAKSSLLQDDFMASAARWRPLHKKSLPVCTDETLEALQRISNEARIKVADD